MIRISFLSNLFNTGLFVAEYNIGNKRPLVYECYSWGHIWEFLNRFLGPKQLQYPENRI